VSSNSVVEVEVEVLEPTAEVEVDVERVDVEVVVERVEVSLGVVGERGETGPQGPPGPAGESGSLPQAYVHAQLTPEVLWTITHALGYFPAVTVVDSAGTLVEGDIRYVSITQIEVSFSAPFAGTAYLS